MTSSRAIALLLRAVTAVWAVTTAVFLLFRMLPADPALALVGIQADPAVVAAVRQRLGLDRPLAMQYLDFFQRLFAGDLGYSFVSHRAVAELLRDRMNITLRIGGLAILLATLASVATSLLLALSSSRRVLASVRVATVAATSVPVFVFALLLSWGVGYRLGLLPMLFDRSAASHVLPVLSLALLPYIWSVRLLSEELDRLRQSRFVQFYRAIGMSEGRIIGRHVLRNALPLLLPVIANIAVAIAIGSFFVEQIFAVPGIGQLTIDSILRYDAPVVQGVALAFGSAIVMITSASGVLEQTISRNWRRAE